MSNMEMAYLVLAIVACMIFMVAIGWVDWSTNRKTERKPDKGEAHSDEPFYQPFIRL